jgi:hypothetical protein
MSNHVIGNANKDLVKTLQILTLLMLLQIVLVSRMNLLLELVNFTLMEFVLKILLHKLTTNTMQSVDSEKRNTLQLINVLTLPSLKRMLDKFLLVKLLFFLTLLLLHKKLLYRNKRKLVKL